MKAVVVTDRADEIGRDELVQRPEPQAGINDVVVQIHASGFVRTEMEWPSTWIDRLDRDRTPSIPGHELAGVVTAVGYGPTGLSVGQRVFGSTDWYRDGTLAEYAAVEARNLAPLPGDVDFTAPSPSSPRPASASVTVVVATTLVSEARSKTVSGRIGRPGDGVGLAGYPPGRG